MSTDNTAPLARPASSMDAEKGVLGSMFMGQETLEKALTLAQPNDFYYPANRLIYEILAGMYAARQPVDLVTVTEVMATRGELENIGGGYFLAELCTFVPSAANLEHYVKILQQKRTLRDIHTICHKYASLAMTGIEDVTDFLDRWQSEVLTVTEGDSKLDTLKHISPGLMEALDALENAYANRGGVQGMETGFHDLNRMTGGWKGGQVILIAGRPAMGKSVMGTNLAENAAAAGVPSAIFSLEMSYNELTARMMCSNARLDLQRMRDGFLSEGDFPRLIKSTGELAKQPVYIDDTPAITINEFRSKLRRAVQKLGIGLVVVDYVGLMKSTSPQARASKVLEMTDISQGLKQTAKELDIPIVVLAQLNRNVEERRGNRPQMSDLRDSGSLEQDADIIGLLYRESYYDGNEERMEAKATALEMSITEYQQKAELIIAKQRNGPTGSVPLRFIGKETRFDNVTERAFSNNPDQRQHHA